MSVGSDHEGAPGKRKPDGIVATFVLIVIGVLIGEFLTGFVLQILG